METIGSYIELILQSLFVEAFAISFLIGAIMFAVGLGFILLFLVSRLTGRRSKGTVAGAIMHRRVKVKTRDGEKKEEVKETLYPVFQYQRSDGSEHLERASEGGSSTLKYVTGQSVNLVVREDKNYDDVYDADSYGALYVGLVSLPVSVVIMLQVGSLASTIGIGILSLLAIIVCRLALAISEKSRNPDTQSKTLYSKTFDPADLKPIEYFQQQKKNAKKND